MKNEGLNPPKVSVVVITYNQEKYIRQCLDSILSQVTDFPYEILVHDDKSTDSTCDILRDYEKRYPSIIHVLFEEENQYSKGNHTIFATMFPFAKGKYISLCEGDDYFSDVHKLQHQYEVMENNPQCHFCVHRVETVKENGESLGISVPKSIKENRELSSEEFIALVRYYEFQTCCYFFRTEDALQFINPLPDYVKCADVGDECYKLFFGSLGPIFYMEETLTHHRAGSTGSWNKRVTQEKRVEHYKRMMAMIEVYNDFTGKRYEKICEDYKLHQEYQIALIREDYRALISKKFRKYFREYGLKRKLRTIYKAIIHQ